MDIHVGIYTLRKKNCMTQEEMAKIVGCSPSSYSNKELGKTDFKPREMKNVAEHFKVSIESIFFN